MYQKLSSDDVQFLRYGAQQTDGWTDGQMDRKSDTEVGAPPKKIKTTISHAHFKWIDDKLINFML